MVVLKPNIVRGGRAIGLGNNFYLMKGRTHAKGGIDVGKNPKTGLEVENNEVMQVSPQGVRVFSAQPILGGISPAQYILGGANPNQVFNAQEQWKKINRINDDGTRKAQFGEGYEKIPNGIKRYYDIENKHDESLDLSKELIDFINQTDYIYNLIDSKKRKNNNGEHPEFWKRLKDNNIQTIDDWENEDSVASHKMAYAEKDGKHYIFPMIQNINGKLVDFTNIQGSSIFGDAFDYALNTGNYIIAPNENIAKEFTQKYKNSDKFKGFKKFRGIERDDDYKSIQNNRNSLKLGINYLRSKGISDEKIAAMLGNAVVESRLNPYQTEKTKKTNKGYGLFQWTHKSRKDNLDKYAPNEHISEFERQLSFALQELENSDNYYTGKKGKKNWDNADTLEKAVKSFENDFEAPIAGSSDRRLNAAKYIYDNMNSFKYGGIHIKPSKRGTFTAAAKKHGMSVQGFASKVLANKGKYSSAMVKKANFARNASKWKHKEFGGDMDFNYWITKDNIYKLGGRKKALNGTDYLKLLWEENSNTPKVKFSGLNVDIPEVPTLSYQQRNNISVSNPIKRDEIDLGISNRSQRIVNNALSNNSRLLEPPLQNTIDRNNALRSIASNQPAIKINNPLDIGNIGNLIGTGINIAGNLISYGINNRALNRMRRPSMPLPLRAENLQTRVSTAAQEAAIRENVAGQEGLISGNLASSRSRLNAINRVRNQGTSMYNQLQDRKQNIETELINRNKLNRQQIGNQNVLQFNNWRDRVTEFDNRITDLRSENKVNLTQGIADAIAGERGYLANRENDARYRMNAFLTTIANPDAFKAMNSAEIRRLARQFGITNQQLKDLGINV